MAPISGVEVISRPILTKMEEIEKLLEEIHHLIPTGNTFREPIGKIKLNMSLLRGEIINAVQPQHRNEGLAVLEFNELLEKVLVEIKLLYSQDLTLKLGSLLTRDLERAMNKLNLKMGVLEAQIKQFIG